MRRLAAEHGFRPSKALGQNFVFDHNTIERVVKLSGIERGDKVVEVGPGFGNLTLALAELAGEVVAIEFDGILADILRKTLRGTDVRLIQGDVMEADLQGELRSEGWLLISNLPYNIATPLVIRILEEVPAIDRLSFMVQKEVADRMVASTGDEAYGAVSVLLWSLAKREVVGKIPRSVFWPKPDVESVVVNLTRTSTGLGVDYPQLKVVVKAAFAQRRKTAVNALAAGLDGDKDFIASVFDALGLPRRMRAEELSLEDFAAITDRLGGT